MNAAYAYDFGAREGIYAPLRQFWQAYLSGQSFDDLDGAELARELMRGPHKLRSDVAAFKRKVGIAA
jgi:hypothetical protein